jgi:hypothetical protein
MYTRSSGPGTRYDLATELQLKGFFAMNTYLHYGGTRCHGNRCRCSEIPDDLSLVQISCNTTRKLRMNPKHRELER